MTKVIFPESVIGIVGGGQLGQMMAMSAKEMGYVVGVLDPAENCPAAQVSDWHIQADYDDKKALKELADNCDVLTYEFENVDVSALEQVKDDVLLPQGTQLLSITQNRVREKNFLSEAQVLIAPFVEVNNFEDLVDGVVKIGFPCVLKTASGGYDGKGQQVLREKSQLEDCRKMIASSPCVLEAWLDFEKEISVLVCGNGQNDYVTLTVGENIHRNNILHETIVPADIQSEIAEKSQKIALKIARALNLAGILAVEMFLTEEGEIYVNELAPRPHNSGHHSIESCSMSQFDLHIRGVCGYPLSSPRLLSSAVMVNILGEHLDATYKIIPEKADWHFHYYGKKEAKVGRKMGHITILTDDTAHTLREIKATKIWDRQGRIK
ncbi:5-(carboxyamino)imidazole ribonucleotide synthase [Vagococcus elongatus]|uniref:5-(carboxyamino)imidazole ribonucleotide synthase n=1 Tax=Vagococcus elongatus TaxID=180344 RepID=UPI001B865F77|nr:5-(carboxyamino)imidazole ribonucleotide synthase [Vagococcus elongatus]